MSAEFDQDIDALLQAAIAERARTPRPELARLREQHWLRCSRCGMGLEMLGFGPVRFEYCFHCGAIFFDAEGLEVLLLLDRSEQDRLLERLAGATARKRTGAEPPPLPPGLRSKPPERGPMWAGMITVGLLVGVLLGLAYRYRSTVSEPSVVPAATAPQRAAAPPAKAPPAPSVPDEKTTAASKADAGQQDGRAPAKTDSEPSDAGPKKADAGSKKADAGPKKADAGSKKADAGPGPVAAKGTGPRVRSMAPPKAPAPKSFDDLQAAGRLAIQRGQGRKALKFYEQSAALRPTSAEAMCGLGWSYVALKMPHIAVLKFQKAQKLHKRYGDSYIGLGKAFTMLGQRAQAVSSYEVYLQLHPLGPSAAIARKALNTMKPKTEKKDPAP